MVIYVEFDALLFFSGMKAMGHEILKKKKKRYESASFTSSLYSSCFQWSFHC